MSGNLKQRIDAALADAARETADRSARLAAIEAETSRRRPVRAAWRELRVDWDRFSDPPGNYSAWCGDLARRLQAFGHAVRTAGFEQNIRDLDASRFQHRDGSSIAIAL